MTHTVKGFGVINKAEVDVFLGEGNGTALQYSCLENPMDGGALGQNGHRWLRQVLSDATWARLGAAVTLRAREAKVLPGIVTVGTSLLVSLPAGLSHFSKQKAGLW